MPNSVVPKLFTSHVPLAPVHVFTPHMGLGAELRRGGDNVDRNKGAKAGARARGGAKSGALGAGPAARTAGAGQAMGRGARSWCWGQEWRWMVLPPLPLWRTDPGPQPNPPELPSPPPWGACSTLWGPLA